MRYIVEKKSEDGGLAIYRVTDTKRPDHGAFPDGRRWTTDVWAGSSIRCVACGGPLAAMSTSCPHANAVKRFLARDGE